MAFLVVSMPFAISSFLVLKGGLELTTIPLDAASGEVKFCIIPSGRTQFCGMVRRRHSGVVVNIVVVSIICCSSRYYSYSCYGCITLPIARICRTSNSTRVLGYEFWYLGCYHRFC